MLFRDNLRVLQKKKTKPKHNDHKKLPHILNTENYIFYIFFIQVFKHIYAKTNYHCSHVRKKIKISRYCCSSLLILIFDL